jgi:hypothetical protein
MTQLTKWTSEELERIGAAEELHIAALRRDSALRKPVLVWVVRHGGDLYVRSVNGRGAVWFRGARARHEGRIRAGGVEKGVTFVDVGDEVNDLVDAAYREKYGRRYPTIVPSIVSPQARAATLGLVPRAAHS